MADTNGILEVVFAAIDELNEQQPKEKRVDKAPDAPLFGKGGKLDSLALVNLIVSIEQGLADRFDAIVSIVDERAMSQKSSPFRSVQALTDYIAGLLDEEAQAAS